MIPSSASVSLICFLVIEVLAALILYYLTKNVSISATIGAVFIVLTVILYVLNSTMFEGRFAMILTQFALFERFFDFTYGIFNLKDVVFYLSFSVFFVFLTVKSLEKKRWM